MMAWARLNLDAIDAAIAGVAVLGPAPDEEPRSPDTLRRLGLGYRYVDDLLAERVDLFAYGNSPLLLELNHRVLCGVTPERRQQYARHIAETERRFYDVGHGIGDVVDWYRRNQSRRPAMLAAGMFVEIVSTPQLFIEGNQRTGTLVAAYLLARAGRPPMVVTAASEARYRTLADRAAAISRTGLTGGLHAHGAASRLADLIEDCADSRFLRAPEPATY